MKTNKLLTDDELSGLPIGFQSLFTETYVIEGDITKNYASQFYQSKKKLKIAILKKPISKFYNDEDI